MKKLAMFMAVASLVLGATSAVEAGTVTRLSDSQTFGTIQGAIDDAGTVNGETLNVSAGVYNEVLWVDKALNILSTDGAVTTIIDATGLSQIRSATLMISAFNVYLGSVGNGFTISGQASWAVLLTTADDAPAGTPYNNINIAGNVLAGSWPERGLGTSGGAYTPLLDSITVTGNQFDGGTYMDTGTNWSLTNNVINGSALTLTGSASGTVNHNDFINGGQISMAQVTDFGINYNNFGGEPWNGKYIDLYNPTTNDVDATLNYWGTIIESEIQDRIGIDPAVSAVVNYNPWLDAASPGGNPIPEPATMSLLGLGGLGVLIRRRRRRV